MPQPGQVIPSRLHTASEVENTVSCSLTKMTFYLVLQWLLGVTMNFIRLMLSTASEPGPSNADYPIGFFFSLFSFPSIFLKKPFNIRE